MLIFNYGHRIALFDIKYPRFLKMDKKMSNFKIHKNFPNTFFAFLYNKLKFLLKETYLQFCLKPRHHKSNYLKVYMT